MRKLVYCIADGMADVPAYCAGGMTPLRAAKMPILDSMARHSVAGLCHVIPDLLPPDSDVGNMALMGYDPLRYHTGRGPIELLGMAAASDAFAISPDDLVWRLSLVCTEGPECIMRDAHGGGIFDEQARSLIAAMSAELETVTGGEFLVLPNEAYRHILVQRGAAAKPEASMRFPGPHTLLGQSVLPILQTYPPALQQALRSMNRIALDDASAPDRVWLWGQGPMPYLPQFSALHELYTCMITGVSLLRGLGRAAGMTVVDNPAFTGLPDTDLGAKAKAAIDFLESGGDAAFIHVEAPDHCAHGGDAEGKRRALEAFDRDLLAPLKAALPDAVFVVTCDHRTSSQTRTHECGAVPFIIHREGLEFLPCSEFSEEGCCGLAEVDSGPQLLELAKRFL
ncbi:alkaline phosphatase family protein [Desulfovibrio mangrovi]|uniref:alkaline phosphatase family protein n=1 Tax=Desulfovibrio mangrovi TaxID=2976983 RepID=UPI0022468B34|nr:alkaline phosphatase family protein [Desulfovibrio mangrovi]UZP68858.1 alkaline phosphatase family protein [Desulfovibrio mangrovi]